MPLDWDFAALGFFFERVVRLRECARALQCFLARRIDLQLFSVERSPRAEFSSTLRAVVCSVDICITAGCERYDSLVEIRYGLLVLLQRLLNLVSRISAGANEILMRISQFVFVEGFLRLGQRQFLLERVLSPRRSFRNQLGEPRDIGLLLVHAGLASFDAHL